jgi:hypothetical protein
VRADLYLVVPTGRTANNFIATPKKRICFMGAKVPFQAKLTRYPAHPLEVGHVKPLASFALTLVAGAKTLQRERRMPFT